MSDKMTAKEKCPACGARWARIVNGWLVSDVHGRASLKEGTAPLSRCPVCGARVQVQGKATVTEEEG